MSYKHFDITGLYLFRKK